MSSSNRNAGRNASQNAVSHASQYAVSHEEVFDDWREHPQQLQALAQADELPNERIEVRINLNQNLIPPELGNALQVYGMAITGEDRGADIIIIISGIPPEHGIPGVRAFGEQVLRIVRQHAQNAVLA